MPKSALCRYKSSVSHPSLPNGEHVTGFFWPHCLGEGGGRIVE
uniref:Uncharacterized protein n=1 Tax=Anguilla anguilla TaxID=7936 RepID=A0A0E9XPC0_ANGAN